MSLMTKATASGFGKRFFRLIQKRFLRISLNSGRERRNRHYVLKWKSAYASELGGKGKSSLLLSNWTRQLGINARWGKKGKSVGGYQADGK